MIVQVASSFLDWFEPLSSCQFRDIRTIVKLDKMITLSDILS